MLKINIGLSRKIGEANYGSRGASVNLELEVDGGLVLQPEELRKKMRYLFELAKESVDEELNQGDRPESRANDNRTGNGHHNGHSRSNSRKATNSQVRAIYVIADRNGIELGDLLRGRYGVTQSEELTITEASQLIDELKGVANGVGGTH